MAEVEVNQITVVSPEQDSALIYDFARYLTKAQNVVRARNEKWWRDLETNEPLQRNVGELFMLMVSEIAEGMEGHRKKLQDDKLPHRSMLEVEMADVLIRLLDFAGGMGLDLAGAFVEKMEYNRTRVDHTHAHRKAPGGKAY